MQQEFDLGKQLKAVWRFKWMIILVVLIAGVTAWRFTSRQSVTYEATAIVITESAQPKLPALPPGLDAVFGLASFQDLGSQIEMMQSNTVLERAITQLEPEKAANPQYVQQEANKLLKSLSVRQVKNSALLTVSVVSLDPNMAQRQANAVAEAYVYQQNRVKLADIEVGLENATNRLKALRAGKIDLSISPSLTRVTSRVDAALAALQTASKYLQSASTRKAAQSPDKRTPAVKDPGTVLTPSQLKTLGMQVEIASSEANSLSSLTRQLNSQLNAEGSELRDIDLANIEVLTRTLATKLGALSTKLETILRAETDTQVQGELSAVDEQLRIANATVGATLERVLALYSVRDQVRMTDATGAASPLQAITQRKEANAILVQRIVEFYNQAATTITESSGQLRKIELTPRTTTVEPWQLARLSEKLAPVANGLSLLARQLNSQAAAQGFELSDIDITSIENQTRTLAANFSTPFAEAQTMRQVESNMAVKEELGVVLDKLRVASDTLAATLDRVKGLYTAEEQSRMASATGTVSPLQLITLRKEVSASLVQRIVQHTNLTATTLAVALGQLEKIGTRASTVTQWQLERLSARAASITNVLTALSQQLQPPSPKQGLLLTYDELAAIEINARTAASNLGILSSEEEKMPLVELDPQTYTDWLSVMEFTHIANDATGGLPEDIAGLVKGGGDNLSYVALDNLRQQLQLTLLTSSGGSRVMDKATVNLPTVNIFGRFRNILMAVVAALLLGVLAALFLQYFDRRVKDVSQATNYIGLPLSACIARMNKANPHTPSILGGSPSYYLEGFRMLRTNLGLDSSQGQILLISSPEEQEGKTTVAANLARVVALQGRKVLLIDGNLRKPDIASVFGLSETDGLFKFLNGENELRDCITQVENVDILPSQAASDRSAEMLSSTRMKVLLEKARQMYDVVIVDSAPIMGCVDARILAREVDKVLLVFQQGTSKLELMTESKQVLETMGVKVPGFVFNRVNPKECKYLPQPVDKKPKVKIDLLGG